MTAVDEIRTRMNVSRACSLLGIPRRTYYAGIHSQHTHTRSVDSRISTGTVDMILKICREWCAKKEMGLTQHEIRNKAT